MALLLLFSRRGNAVVTICTLVLAYVATPGVRFLASSEPVGVEDFMDFLDGIDPSSFDLTAVPLPEEAKGFVKTAPKLIPILLAKVQDEKCKKLGKDVSSKAVALAKENEDTINVIRLKEIICELGDDCAEHIVDAVRGILKTPFLKKLIGENANIQDIETYLDMIPGGYAMFCAIDHTQIPADKAADFEAKEEEEVVEDEDEEDEDDEEEEENDEEDDEKDEL